MSSASHGTYGGTRPLRTGEGGSVRSGQGRVEGLSSPDADDLSGPEFLAEPSYDRRRYSG